MFVAAAEHAAAHTHPPPSKLPHLHPHPHPHSSRVTAQNPYLPFFVIDVTKVRVPHIPEKQPANVEQDLPSRFTGACVCVCMCVYVCECMCVCVRVCVCVSQHLLRILHFLRGELVSLLGMSTPLKLKFCKDLRINMQNCF